MASSPRRRWPSWVYDSGEEPDYRFSFANERTFLAWIRTALALLAGGVALDFVEVSAPSAVQRGLAVCLVGLACLCAVAAWYRWAKAERAMREKAPLPSSSLTAVMAAVVIVVGAVLLVVVL